MNENITRVVLLSRLYKIIHGNIRHIQKALFLDYGRDGEDSYYMEIKPVLSALRGAITKSAGPGKSPMDLDNTILINSYWDLPFKRAMLPLIYAIRSGSSVILNIHPRAKHTYMLLSHLIGYNFNEKYISLAQLDRDGIRRFSKYADRTICFYPHKLPVVVRAWDDIPALANSIVFSKFMNCGQNIEAPNHIICEKSVQDLLERYLIREIESQIGNDPLIEEDYGKIIDKRHFDRLLNLIDRDRVIYGVATCERTLQIGPCIMNNVTYEDKIMKYPILGPILPIITMD